MSTDKNSYPCDIAIVGMGSVFPGTTHKDDFWKDICAGIDRITEVPRSHWKVEQYFDKDPLARDKTYCKRGGFLPNVEFDPLTFGLPPNALTATDTGQLLGLLVAKNTLDDFTNHGPLNVDRERVSVILGTTGATELITDMASRLERPRWYHSLLEEGIPEEQALRICERVSAQYPEWQESTFPGLLSNVIAGRIANRLNLKGTNLVTDAACASSLAALQFSINELLLNQSDLVITGGVDTLNTIFMYMCFSKTPALSPTGDCRPFSENADGTLIGEGIGMIALKRLADAERAGDPIYAVIKGLGTSSDGLGKSIYAPVAEGQSRALRKAYENAQYTPQTVELVEAHGTGTKAGDLCELESLNAVFNVSTARKWCALGSVKSQIGHTKAAAGVAGMIKATLALQNKILPPTIKVTNPHSKIQDENSAFYVNTQSKPWIRDKSHPRRASVSSFGFGGSNFHVTLEEYKGSHSKKKVRNFESELFLFGASSKEDLITQLRSLNTQREFNLLAKDVQERYLPGSPVRLAFAATGSPDLKEKVELCIRELPKKDPCLVKEIYFSSQVPQGKLAILFPGQGSQYVDMGSKIAMTFDSAREVWDQIAGIDLLQTEEKLHQTVFPTSSFSELEKAKQDQKLQDTQWAQAAIACTSVAMLSVIQSFGIEADFYTGHSLGALTALYAGGSLGLTELVHIARKRGLLMASTVQTSSGMLAVSTSEAQCRNVLEEGVCIANINSQDQTVLSGSLSKLEKIAKHLSTQKISHRLIPVSTAFHSPQMRGIQEAFGIFLKTLNISKTRKPTLSCLDAGEYPSDAREIVTSLVQELTSPVKFLPTIMELYKGGVRTFLEVGPKSVLSKLCRRILRGKDALILALDEKELDPLFSLWNTLAQLAVAGIPMNFRNLCEEFACPQKAGSQNTSFKIDINGANLRPNPSAVAPKTEETKSSIRVETTKEKAQMDSRTFAETNSTTSVSRLSVAKDLQKELARIHSEFQKTFSETHLAYLKSTQHCFDLLVQMESVVETVHIPSHSPAIDENSPVKLLPSQVVLPEASIPVSVEKPVEPFRFSSLSASEKVEAPVKKEANSDIRKILIDVIAEKTGYPHELIKIEMSLDTDLGIDSIKRVEIFSQLAERVPQAADIDPQTMNKLSSLKNILDFLEEGERHVPGDLLAKKKSTQTNGLTHIPLNA